LTADVWAENGALAEPADAVTLESCTRPDGVLVNVTVAPPEGAGPLKVTVPLAALPPTVLAGLKLRLETTTGELEGLTVTVALGEVLL
jgi:hypothetical protein